MEGKNRGAILGAVVVLVIFGVLVFFLAKDQDSGNPVAQNTTESTTQQEVLGETNDAGKIGENEIKLTEDNFTAQVKNATGVFLVDFYLSTCPHCQNVGPVVTAISDELVGQAKVGKIEANENANLSNEYDIQSVPTFIVFKDGKEVKREVGEMTKDQLIELVNSAL